MSASPEHRAEARASIALKSRKRAARKKLERRPGIAISVKLKDDPKRYYREYARKYYQNVRKFNRSYLDYQKNLIAHRFAQSCPYPQMAHKEAIESGLSIVHGRWLRESWYYTDREDVVQEEALQRLLSKKGCS